MHRARFAILSLFVPFLALGQTVVKVNILELAGKIAPPPATAREAYSRSACQEDSVYNGAVRCSAEAFYRPALDKIEATNQQLGKAIETLSKPQIDAAKQMDQKEMQKKFKSMSKEEQMKMAMEMSKTMGMAPRAMVPEPPPVQAAQEECMKVMGEIGEDMQKFQDVYQRREKLSQDRDARHKEIDTWQQAEAEKLPQISTGEMSYAEPKALHALLMKANDKHLAVESDYLKGMQKEWKETWDHYRTRYATLQEKLAAIHYGEDAKNPETHRQLLSAQQQMVSGTADLMKLSRESTDDSSVWWGRKLKLDREKPKQ